MSVDFWRVSGAELARPTPGGVPAAALWVIRAFNLVFNGLNALWFSKMLRGAIKARRTAPWCSSCCPWDQSADRDYCQCMRS